MASGLRCLHGASAVCHVITARGSAHDRVPIRHLLTVEKIVLEITDREICHGRVCPGNFDIRMSILTLANGGDGCIGNDTETGILASTRLLR